MWKPSARSPYMLPSASPLTSADDRSMVRLWTRRRGAPRPLVRQDRQDLVILEAGPDVVVFADRLVVPGREGLVVGLDQPFVAVDLVHRVADRLALGAARLLDGERGEVPGVVGVRDADRRRYVARPLHVRVFRLERRQHPLADGRELAEEAVGLDKHHIARTRARELGEAAASRAPMGDDGHLPAHAVERLHDLRGGTDIA